MVYVTVNTNEAADILINTLLQERKVASVNKIKKGMYSSYSHNGKVEVDEAEILLMMKTKSQCINDVCHLVKENHPYGCPEIVAVPINSGNNPHIQWIKDETKSALPDIPIIEEQPARFAVQSGESIQSQKTEVKISEIIDYWFGVDEQPGWNRDEAPGGDWNDRWYEGNKEFDKFVQNKFGHYFNALEN